MHTSAIYVRLYDEITSGEKLMALIAEQDATTHPDCIILDEVDTLDSETLQVLLVFLLDCFERSPIILFGRGWPDLLAEEENMLREQTILLPLDERRMCSDYIASREQCLLSVFSFGQGRVLLNGIPVDLKPLTHPFRLLFYAVSGADLTRSAILTALWPHLGTQEATNSLNATRQTLRDMFDIDFLEWQEFVYRINPLIDVEHDVTLFETTVDQALMALSPDMEALQLADTLYTQPYLMGLDEQWVQQKRTDLLETQVEQLVFRARAARKSGDVDQALGLYHRAFALQPERDDIADTLMTLYDERDQPCAALAVYQHFEQSVRAKTDHPPAPQLQKRGQYFMRLCDRT